MWFAFCIASLALAQDAPKLLVDQALGADVPIEYRSSTYTGPFFGDTRMRFDALQPMVVDAEGTESGRASWVTSRLRMGWAQTKGTAQGQLELEAFSGRFSGGTELGTAYAPDVFAVDRTGSGAQLLQVIPRQAWGGVAGRAGVARIGAQTFTWGTGMLANDGAGDPVFGDAVRGSVVNRLLGVWTPWRGQADRGALQGVALIGAADVVLRDDNANLFVGDLATQAVLGIRSDAPRWRAGVLGILRYQRDRIDPYHPLVRPETVAVPVDGYLRVQLTDPEQPQTVGLEGEVVGITGRTNRSVSDATIDDGARIRSGAFVSRVRYDHTDWGLTAVLETGAASGDNDARDDRIRTFSMHSDHNVGLVLFDELLPMLTARSVDRIADPALSGVPAPGGRFVVNQGQVSNAIYVYPTVRWRLAPYEFRLGAMQAWSAGDWVDVYESALNGGYNQTFGGQSPGGRDLGREALLGARRYVGLGPSELELGVEGALFFAGGAMEGLDIDTLGTVRARMDLRW